MDEADLIELLGDLHPYWRDHHDDPYDAAEAYGIETSPDPDAYTELDFGD